MQHTATHSGAWEEMSESLDLCAGTWYTKEEFLHTATHRNTMQHTATHSGAWEEMSESLDLCAGTWYTKEEFLDLYLNHTDATQRGEEEGGNERERSSVIDALGGVSAGGSAGSGGRVRAKSEGRGRRDEKRGDVQNLEVWGVRLGDVWAVQDWNAKHLDLLQHTAATTAAATTSCSNIRHHPAEIAHCNDTPQLHTATTHAAAAAYAAAQQLGRVLAMTGPVIMAQLIPSWEAAFPGHTFICVT